MRLERRMPHGALAALVCVACQQTAAPAAPEIESTTRGGFAVNDLDERWPNNTIRYNFYDSWGDENVPQSVRTKFADAVAYIEARTPLNFYEIYNTDGDYLMVYNEPDEDYSHAEVGFQGGETSIWLKDDIAMLGIVHELGHNLGMRHEHQRPDRDAFVTVVYANIDSGDHDNFDIEDPDDHDVLTPYDHHSAMHYGNKNQCIKTWDFTVSPPVQVCQTTSSITSEGYITTDMTMKARAGIDTAPDVPGIQDEIKASKHLSKHDINALWLMYARKLSLPIPDERMGEAIVVADFDQDGYDDIAIGAPNDYDEEEVSSGSVFVFKGTERMPVPWLRLHHGQLGTRGEGDDFGAALAVGDFNGDEFPDLAVGAPGARSPSGLLSGTVTLFRGGQFEKANFQPGNSAGVCTSKCGQTAWAPLSPWLVVAGNTLPNVNETGVDRFGAAVAAGDGNGDGMDELLVGAPYAPSSLGSGQAYFFRGNSLGASTITGGFLSTHSIATSRYAYGSAITTGDFDGDGKMDVAVGAPSDREQVVMFCGTHPRQMFRPEQRIDSNPGTDGFGSSLTTGRLLENGMMGDALVIGAPTNVTYAGVAAGRAYVYGREGGVGSCAVFAYGLVEGATANERFGHAVAVANVNLDNRDDLLVGAPEAGNGTGRVQRILNDGWSLAYDQNLAVPSDAQAFGSSLAAGVVKVDPFPFAPDGLATAPIRLLVGAPEATTPWYPVDMQAGGVYGFSTDSSGTLLRGVLHQQTDSPFSL